MKSPLIGSGQYVEVDQSFINPYFSGASFPIRHRRSLHVLPRTLSADPGRGSPSATRNLAVKVGCMRDSLKGRLCHRKGSPGASKIRADPSRTCSSHLFSWPQPVVSHLPQDFRGSVCKDCDELRRSRRMMWLVSLSCAVNST